MSTNKSEIQHNFLNMVQKSKQCVSIFLKSGIQLRGKITRFDDYVIILTKDNTTQMVYKHAISTICLTQVGSNQNQHNIDQELRDVLAKNKIDT